MNDEAPGWDAIDLAMEKLYPKQNPKHWGTMVNYRLGGKDPLDGISCYDGGGFWHFVTYGFSDLYEKSADSDKERSGFGFELTYKLKKYPEIDDNELMAFCGNLQSLARYVFQSGKIFFAGTSIYTKQTNGIDRKQVSKITGFGIIEDKLGTIDTAFGKVQFICLVGLMDDELKAIHEKKIAATEVLKRLNTDVTDYKRIKSVV